MEHVSLDDLENVGRWASVTKRFGEPLGLSDSALNYYELEPSEEFTGAMHAHMGQEEVFYVLEGVATFETPDDEYTVTENEAIRFAPGEYQQGRNKSDAVIRALVFGAPKDAGETRVHQACEVCGDASYHVVTVDDSGFTLECPECGYELNGQP